MQTERQPKNDQSFRKTSFKFSSSLRSKVAAIGAVLALGGLYYHSKQMVPFEAWPKKFQIQGEWLTIGEDFKINGPNGCFARIDQEVMNLKPTFRYIDNDRKNQVRAKVKLVSLKTAIEVHNREGALIGSIEERLFTRVGKLYTGYDIKGPTGKVIATSEKIDFVGTAFTIKDTEGVVIATMSRAAYDPGKATWSCELHDSEKVDPSVICLIPAFYTYADNTKKKELKEAQNKKKEATKSSTSK